MSSEQQQNDPVKDDAIAENAEIEEQSPKNVDKNSDPNIEEKNPDSPAKKEEEKTESPPKSPKKEI